MTEKIYYVYQHFRKDNHSCIYIGKGHGKRIKNNKRNLIHDQIMSDVGIEKVIYKDNLSEEEAYQIEHDLIHHYVFDLNYGIDIEGYRKNDPLHFLTNKAWGGKGLLGLERPEHSLRMIGENNPMYGVNVWEKYSEERTFEIKAKISKASSGENNPMYGISPEERMDPSTYQVWKKKNQERLASQVGEANPNYGNDTLKKKLEANPHLKSKYYSRPRSQNGRARKIEIYTLNWERLKSFECILDCAEYVKETLNSPSKLGGMCSNIGKAARQNQPYKGFRFKFLD